MKSVPRDLTNKIEPLSPEMGGDERFTGYGVMGQPFNSGHLLALRRFPHNTIGDPYTSVWHCDPSGRWTMWNDATPLASCPRYFGPAIQENHECAIDVEWSDECRLRVHIADVLDWNMRIRPTVSTRTMSALGAHLPQRLWQNQLALKAMGRVAGPMLHAGALRMQGTLPSRQRFSVRIPFVWATCDVRATLFDRDLGFAGRVPTQRWLGGFALPNRGLFAIGQVAIEESDAERHLRVVPSANPAL
jgi:hypothetical protein